jgi:sialate O-acetylesterase
MKQFLSAAAFSLSFIFYFNGFAEIKPARIFSDNMVLQREIKIPVWGTATPGEEITVSFNGKSVSGNTNDLRKWNVFLPEFEAGGHRLTIKGFIWYQGESDAGGVLICMKRCLNS